jgi:Bacterial Ig-like domain (group 3)/Neocarzinostatin family
MSAQKYPEGAGLLKINKIAAGTALSVLASGLMIATATTGAGVAAAAQRAPSVVPNATVTISPKSQLVDGEHVTVHMSGFNDPDGTTLHIGQCSFQIFQHQEEKYCGITAQGTTATTTGGAATTTFTVRTKSWKPQKAGLKCNPTNACDIIVTDNLDPSKVTYAGFAALDLGKKTKTTVSGKKKLKAGASLKLTSKTTNTFKPTGTVTFKDGKKTIKKVKESASGVAKVTEKHLKAGTHKITAVYSGDPNNKTSKGSLTVKVKK